MRGRGWSAAAAAAMWLQTSLLPALSAEPPHGPPASPLNRPLNCPSLPSWDMSEEGKAKAAADAAAASAAVQVPPQA